MLLSKKVLLGGVAAAALAMPAFAEDRSTEKQKEQYLYQQNQEHGLRKQAGDGAIGATKPSSGPGVQGAPDTRTGPSTRGAGTDAGATTGASPGESGMGNDGTQPSQDSSGVQGFPDTRTGPSTHAPGEGSKQ